MKLFATSLLLRKDLATNFRLVLDIRLALSPEEALGQALLECLKEFPTAELVSHQMQEVPESYMRSSIGESLLVERLKNALRGGNALGDTAQLLDFLADRLTNKEVLGNYADHPNTDFILAAHERANMIRTALEKKSPNVEKNT